MGGDGHGFGFASAGFRILDPGMVRPLQGQEEGLADGVQVFQGDICIVELTGIFASIDNQVKIFLSLIDVHILLSVHSSHINGVFDGHIDKLGKNNTCFHAMEQVIRIGIERKVLSAIFVFL